MPDTTHTSAHSEIETLRTEIRQLQVDLASLADSVRDVARAGRAKAMDRMNDTAEKAWSEAKSLAEKLTHEVEEKPVTAMASAFVIGILLGVVTRRRT